MARRPPSPKPATPPADVSPFDVGEDDEIAGGGIPDDDGWIHLKGKEPKSEEEKPKQRPARRRS